MTAYRFCRPDDMQLLIHAINTCVIPHIPGAAEFTAEDYSRSVRDFGLWASSSMIASDKSKDDIVSVCVGAKHATQTTILFLGTRPDRVREGHASHLLDSLSRKFAVLGPPTIICDVPEDKRDLISIFEKMGYLRSPTNSSTIRFTKEVEAG